MRRRFFAEEVAAVAGIESERIVAAFAAVRREDFLGTGPWDVVVFGDGGTPSYRKTRDADPAGILHNVVVAIDPARNLNNGQPSALANWMNLLEVTPGDSVLHVGAGVGYYSAILAELTGPDGRVTAIEIDPVLAARAQSNLVPWPHARVFAGDGRDTHGTHDAILINAGATLPRREWLDALKPGGRLVVPLTVAVPGGLHGAGLMLRVQDGSARFTLPVQILRLRGRPRFAAGARPEDRAVRGTLEGREETAARCACAGIGVCRPRSRLLPCRRGLLSRRSHFVGRDSAWLAGSGFFMGVAFQGDAVASQRFRRVAVLERTCQGAARRHQFTGGSRTRMEHLRRPCTSVWSGRRASPGRAEPIRNLRTYASCV